MTTLITRTVFQYAKKLAQIPNISVHRQTSIRYASKYKAAVIANTNTKALTIEERKQSALKDTDVRIAVAYCSVNIHDVNSFSNPMMKFPFVPGYEVSGEIMETGKEAGKLFRKEDRVIALSNDWGGLASECIVDYHDVWNISPSLPLDKAAALPYTYGEALYAFGALSPVIQDRTVMVSVGAAGGGLAAVDIAANVYKAKVIAVTDTEEDAELTRNQGAVKTLHYKDNLLNVAKKTFGDKMADVVYDAVGGEIHEKISACVGPSGNIFVLRYGQIMVPQPHATLTHVSLSALRCQKLLVYRQIVQDVMELMEQGHVSPCISKTFKLEDVNQAVEFIIGKKYHGKVVVQMP